ncbi:CdaR family protein [Clostridium intestinale]|uniref:YbbR-like domain-containing protein n=1 Tax=Clostridium intestinale TaxID=36845 RepID=A0A7D6ZG62_9CLOT|nr:CdaR family protein [Clostridium intestinale]QLY79481.1 hypothetical protein HZF06_20995 [Clostridium intestinale]
MDQKSSKKRQIIIQLICLVLSFGLWLYISNVENPVTTYNLDKVPVELINETALNNSGLTLSPNQNVYVDLKLEGPRSELYSVKRDQFKVTVDLGDYVLKKGENSVPVEIVDYPDNINIKKSSNLKVNIVIDELQTRSVSIKQELTLTAKNGYYLGETTLSYNKVNISGPAEYVNSVQNVVAKGEFKSLDSDLLSTVQLKAVDDENKVVENVTIQPSTVDITVPVRQLKPAKVSVKTSGQLRSDLAIKAITPSKTYIELKGDKDITDKISEVYTEAIDLSKITSTTDISVKLSLPEGVQSVDNTISVNVEVEKIISKDFSVPLITKGLGDNFNSALSKTEVKVTVKGNESSVSKVNVNMFKGEVDLTSLTEGSYDISPKITFDNSIENITITSNDKVKATITKKEQ